MEGHGFSRAANPAEPTQAPQGIKTLTQPLQNILKKAFPIPEATAGYGLPEGARASEIPTARHVGRR